MSPLFKTHDLLSLNKSSSTTETVAMAQCQINNFSRITNTVCVYLPNDIRASVNLIVVAATPLIVSSVHTESRERNIVLYSYLVTVRIGNGVR